MVSIYSTLARQAINPCPLLQENLDFKGLCDFRCIFLQNEPFLAPSPERNIYHLRIPTFVRVAIRASIVARASASITLPPCGEGGASRSSQPLR